MNKDKLFPIAEILFTILAALLLGYIFFNRVLPWLLPFLIAWMIAFAVRPLATKIAERTHLPVKLLRVVIALAALALVALVGGFVIWQTALAVIRFLSDLGSEASVGEMIEALGAPLVRIFRGSFLPDELRDELGGAFSSAISSLAARLGGALSGFIGGLPRVLISAVVTLLAVVYFALDLEVINSLVRRLLPDGAYRLLVRVKDGFISVGVKYIRSYALLSFLTFSLTLIGLVLLGVDHAVVIALLAAAFDVLPVIGVGTLFVPWGITELFLGRTFVGVSLLILFAAVALVRQIIEPRVVGKSLNIHPILTLFFIYVGYAVFGLVGLLLLPIFAVALAVIGKDKERTDGHSPS